MKRAILALLSVLVLVGCYEKDPIPEGLTEDNFYIGTFKIGEYTVELGKSTVSLSDEAQVLLKADTIRRPQDVFGTDDSVLIFEQAPITEVVKVIREKTGIQIDLAQGLEKNLITTRINSNEPDIAGELAFLCGCKCETLVKGKHYRLYEK